jgi:hypothetical protein
VLQAKCLSELLSSTLKGNNQLGFVFTYVVLFLWLGFTVFWCVTSPHLHVSLWPAPPEH